MRNRLDSIKLSEIFGWTEEEFLRNTEGSAIRRLSYELWIRNIAIALGNADSTPDVIDALKSRQNDSSDLVREHVDWALDRHA